jgi:NADH-quinone oxidoreductase subunit A
MTAVVVPILLMVLVALGLSVAMVAVGKLLGPGRSGAVKQMPYESGMDPIHDTRRRFDVRFYMVAIAFLIFDVELLFLYPWAVARTHPEGLAPAIEKVVTEHAAYGERPLAGYVAGTGYKGEHFAATVAERTWIVFFSVLTFLATLTAGFVYCWKKGLFQWR